MWKNRAKKKLFINKLLILILILLFIIAGSLVFIRSGFFTVKKVEIVQNGIECTNDNDLRNFIDLNNKNIFSVNKKSIVLNIKKSFYCIKDVSISFQLPSEVKVEVIPRQASAVVFSYTGSEASSSAFFEKMATPSAEQNGQVYQVDNEGVIFSKNLPGQGLIKIFIQGLGLDLGKKLGGDTKNIFRILEKTRTFGVEALNAAIINDTLILFSEPRIIFNTDERLDIQLASLQLILSEAKINSRKLDFIDLRFDKPIIRYGKR